MRYRLQLHAIRAFQYLKEIRSPCHQPTMMNLNMLTLSGINTFDMETYEQYFVHTYSDGLVGCIEMCKQSVNRLSSFPSDDDDDDDGSIPNHIFHFGAGFIWIILIFQFLCCRFVFSLFFAYFAILQLCIENFEKSEKCIFFSFRSLFVGK